MLLGTGFRIAEAERLQWCDFSQDPKTKQSFLRVRQSKNGMPRTNPITPELAQTLQALRAHQARVMGRLPQEDGYVLLTPDGKKGWVHVPYRIYRGRLFRRILKLAGLRHAYADGETLDWHALRHSYCCFLREAGVDFGTAAVLMEQKTLAMTQRTYSRYDRIEKRGAIAALPVFRASSVPHPCQGEARSS